MTPITVADPQSRSTDIVSDNVGRIAELFPEAVTEGKVDVDVLRQLLGGAVDERDEKYGLNWHGKRRARQLALTLSTGTLRPAPDDSVDWNTTRNLMIEGDNLEVLKLLQKSYSGKVKLIYIDPPYNTGNDLVYPDDFRDSIENYKRLTGQVDGEGQPLTSNPETSGRFHTDWLNMMYPRLKMARNLMREDGAIFVSIADQEVHNLRGLLDEVFGSENFLATLIWQKMDSPSRNDEGRAFSDYHDYIVVYARDKEVVTLEQKGKPEIVEGYNVTLPDGRSARARQLRKNGKGARREDRPTLWFSLQAPDGTEVWPIAPEGWEGRWVLSRETWEERTSRGLTQWTKRSYGWVPYYLEIAPDEPTVPWPTLLSDVDQNRQAKAAFTALMGPAVDFTNPKPVNLIKTFLQMGHTEDEIILDFFAGSGTTAHATWELNAEAETDGRRRCILVQLPEPTGSKQYPTIAELTKERLRRAGKKVKLDNPLFAGDIGFRVYKLDTSNIRPWNPQPADLGKSLFDSVDHLEPRRTEADVLAELLLKLGLDLCVPVETKMIAGKEVHSVGGGVLLVCLATSVTAKQVEPLALGIVEWHKTLAPAGESQAVFRDAAFADDVAKTNLTAILAQYGLTNVRSL